MQWSELVVLSHLRWDWVWQRPQHLISRMANGQPTWFVEEPRPGDVDEPTLRWSESGPVTRVWLEVPDPKPHHHFTDPVAERYGEVLGDLLGRRPGRAVWVYTAMAFDLAHHLEPSFVVYDVMDDLASFKDAPPGMPDLHRKLLANADAVFTGGRSLQRGVVALRPDAHCFPSGVELEHFLRARATRATRPRRPRPVAGYVGVIDERVDLDLLAGLADALSDWDITVVGPVAKIDPDDCPKRPNLRYPGPRQYADLPEVMAGFDVAIMPFALNESTRSISPTKTLEYVAAGLNVVSTRVPDVVADYSGIVRLADDVPTFAAACRDAYSAEPGALDQFSWPLLRRQHWNAIATRMAALLEPLAGTRLDVDDLVEETV